MSNQGINALEAFTSSTLNAKSGSDPFLRNCPYCHSEHVKTSHRYQTQNNGERTIYFCQDCGSFYSETYGTPIARLTTPLSEIIKVLKARMEGMVLTATTRVFGLAKNTILNGERR
jgi:transposase-like protein